MLQALQSLWIKKNGAVTLREAKTKEHAIREKVREIDRGVDSEPKKKKKRATRSFLRGGCEIRQLGQM